MKIVKLLISILLLIQSFLKADAQLISLNASLEKDSIMIGEQINFVINVVQDKSASIAFPLISDTLVRNVEVLNRGEIDTVFNGKELVLTQKYLITAFDSGIFILPAYPFGMQFGDVRDTLFSLPVMLFVNKPVVDMTAGFRDIKAPLNTPVNLLEILPYAAIGLAFVLAILGFVLLYKKLFRKEKPGIPAGETIPPYLLAMKELQRMLDEKSWERDTIKDYYTRLSSIVRKYLENQFHFPALESTTREILNDFEKVYGKDKALRYKLEDLLQLSDLVKFAKELPLPDENRRNIDKAIEFVELTKPEVSETNE